MLVDDLLQTAGKLDVLVVGGRTENQLPNQELRSCMQRHCLFVVVARRGTSIAGFKRMVEIGKAMEPAQTPIARVLSHFSV